jgi:hypothetical protein
MTPDEALADAVKQRAGCMSVESPCSMCRTLETLENEVRRLREVQTTGFDNVSNALFAANAKLARVEALLSMEGHVDREDIRAALKDKP